MPRFPAIVFPANSLAAGRMIVLLVGLVGCSPTAAPPAPPRTNAAEEPIHVPDGAPEELAPLLDDTAAKAVALAGDAQSLAGQTRDFRALVRQGVAIADKLIEHNSADDAEIAHGRRSKLTLLYLGAQHDPWTFQSQLEAYSDSLAADAPGGAEAAAAAACLVELKYLGRQSPLDDTAPQLVDYAKSYPASTIGPELFRRYAKELEARGDRAGARKIYQLGIDAYGGHSTAASLTHALTRLDHAGSNAASGDPRAAAIQSQLGPHRDGYFVIYAEEQVTAPRHGGMYWYHYEYEVLEGPLAAVNYILHLPPKYTWKLVRWFPQTNAGRTAAYELWKELMQKKGQGA